MHDFMVSEYGPADLASETAARAGTSEAAAPSDTNPAPIIARFGPNRRGRDWIVGDIHGEFDQLRAALEGIQFDPAGDRLFSVGDLIDRGPESHEALSWLESPGFHALRGNHEDMLLGATHDPRVMRWWLEVNGGDWWRSVPAAERPRWIEGLEQLPWAIEVNTGNHRIGLVHADIPGGLSWDAFCEALERGDEAVRNHALWSRTRAQGLESRSVPGVDRIYCGHTPFPQPRTIGNVVFLDTGACYGGRLTLHPLRA